MRTAALAVAAAFLAAGCIQVPDNATIGGQPPDPGVNGTIPDGAPGGSGDGSAGGTGSPTAPGSAGGPGSMSMSGTGSPPGGTTSSAGTGVFYEVPRAVHEAAWLCQTAITVDDLTAGGTDDQQCKVTLSFSDTMVTVTSTGIPNHDYESGGGCCAKTRALTNTFPLKPEMAKTVTDAPIRGSIATAVNGAEIYGPEDADDADVVIVTYSSPTAQPRLEMCDAHSTPNSQGGAFHYHADGNCIHWHAGAGEGWADYTFEKVDSTVHSKIIAWAPDGFPIYGTYGYAADNVSIKEIKSSYRLKTGATGSNGIADQEYVAGMGDLDECNGRFGKTPEFPAGIYHYHSTRKNGEGGYGFPYFPLCYKGVVASSTGGGTGGGGMGGGSTSTSGTMSGPPPSGSMSGSMSSSSGAPPPPSGSSSTSGSCPPPPPPGSSPTGPPPPPGCGPPPP